MIEAKTTSGNLQTPEQHFEACLERAARGLCKARGIDPDAMMTDATNTSMVYFMCPAWKNAAVELKDVWLVAMFVKTLP